MVSQFIKEAIDRFCLLIDMEPEYIVIGLDAWHLLMSENSNCFEMYLDNDNQRGDFHGRFGGIPIKIDAYNEHKDCIEVRSKIPYYKYEDIRSPINYHIKEKEMAWEEYMFYDDYSTFYIQVTGRYKFQNDICDDYLSLEITEDELMSLLNYGA